MIFLRNSIRNYSTVAAFALIGFLLAGCASTAPKKADAQDSHATAVNHLRFDPLRVGDSIRVDFSGTPTLIPTVQTDIKGDGTIRLDFIGDVQAEGLTPGELEREIQTNYVPAYYTHMSVTVTPVARFFYVEGEVLGSGTGGRILYSGPITVTRAIAAAGDFNPFADRKHVKLYRVNANSPINVNCIKALDDPSLDLPVYPGDKIVVKRRLW
jgi:polysaccharide export outer membrane protein